MSLKDPKNSLESDPWFGTIMIVIFSLVLPIPFAVIAEMFYPFLGNSTGLLWFAMCIGFPIWAFWYATRPFDRC